jgi:hypothetical protein
MHASPEFKEYRLSESTVAALFRNYDEAVRYVLQDFMQPAYKSMFELHQTIDEVYTQDYVQQRKRTLNF